MREYTGRKQKKKLTTLCYIEKDCMWLMLHRNKKENDPNEGKWIGIGGKFEEGETPDECIKREVFEETGLTLTDYEPAGIVHFRSDRWTDEDMYLYFATGFEGDLLETCDEGELKWVKKEDVLELPTWDGDKFFIKKLLKGDRNIEVTLRYTGMGEEEHLWRYVDNVAYPDWDESQPWD